MATESARQQHNDERRQRIVDEARRISDVDGWSAVTTRRLAEAIGFTQPVLYGHFPGGKSEIVRAVALEGFTDLAQRCRASIGRRSGRRAVEAVARTYLDFAAEHPARYEAMFRLPLAVRFAAEDTEDELRAGFDALARALGDDGDGTATEIFWGALHGVSELERAGRMRPEHRERRIAELGTRFVPPPG